MKKLMIGLVLCLASTAQATEVVIDARLGTRQDSEILRRLDRLERRNIELTQKVNRLEAEVFGRYQPQPPPPPVRGNIACGVNNSISGLIYTGVSNNQLEAEARAVQSCKEQDSYKFNCDTNNIRCETEDLYAPTTCSSKNSISNNLYIGKAASKIEAESIALKECRRLDAYKSNCVIDRCTK